MCVCVLCGRELKERLDHCALLIQEPAIMSYSSMFRLYIKLEKELKKERNVASTWDP